MIVKQNEISRILSPQDENLQHKIIGLHGTSLDVAIDVLNTGYLQQYFIGENNPKPIQNTFSFIGIPDNNISRLNQKLVFGQLDIELVKLGLLMAEREEIGNFFLKETGLLYRTSHFELDQHLHIYSGQSEYDIYANKINIPIIRYQDKHELPIKNLKNLKENLADRQGVIIGLNQGIMDHFDSSPDRECSIGFPNGYTYDTFTLANPNGIPISCIEFMLGLGNREIEYFQEYHSCKQQSRGKVIQFSKPSSL